jgi:hypothetical protein
MTDTDIVSAAAKQKVEEEGEENGWNFYCCEEKAKQFTKISSHYKLFLKVDAYVKKRYMK